jgi:hypothetical protein
LLAKHRRVTGEAPQTLPQPQLQASQHQELPRPRHAPAPLSPRQQQHSRQLKQQRQGQRQWEHQPGSVEGPHALIQLIERPDSSSAQPAGTASAQPLKIVAPPRRVADAALSLPFANAASPQLRIAPTQSWPTVDIRASRPSTNSCVRTAASDQLHPRRSASEASSRSSHAACSFHARGAALSPFRRVCVSSSSYLR